MSATVTVLLILKGHMHINNVLTEVVGHTRETLFPFLMYRAKSPLQGNTTCHLTAQCLYTRELLQQGYHRHTFSYGMKGIRWDPLYSNWFAGRKKGIFFLLLTTGCFCNRALIREKNTHNPVILSIQICKDVNRCSPSRGLETNPMLTPRHFRV